MFWRVFSAFDQGFNRQYETSIFSFPMATFIALFGTFLCYFVTGNDFLCMGSAEVCLRCAVGEMWWKSQELSAGEPCLPYVSLGNRQLGLHGTVVSPPFLSLREPVRFPSSCWDVGLVRRRLSAIWRRLGLCWYSQSKGPLYFPSGRSWVWKLLSGRKDDVFPKESKAPTIISNIRDSLCRVSPGILGWLSAY